MILAAIHILIAGMFSCSKECVIHTCASTFVLGLVCCVLIIMHTLVYVCIRVCVRECKCVCVYVCVGLHTCTCVNVKPSLCILCREYCRGEGILLDSMYGFLDSYHAHEWSTVMSILLLWHILFFKRGSLS